MQYRLRLMLFLVIFLINTPAARAADAVTSYGSIGLTVGGEKVYLHKSPVLVDGEMFVPLPALNAVGAKYETDKKQKQDGQEVRITPASGRKFSCRARVIDGELMVPIRDIAPELGAVLDWDESARTLSVRARIEQVEFDGSELRVRTSYPVAYTVTWWKVANKLILDMRGVHLPVKQSELSIDNTTSVPIRTGMQKDGETARIVLDMPCAVERKVRSAPKTSKIVVSVSGLRLPPSLPTESPREMEVKGQPQPPVPELPPAGITDINYRKLSSRRLEVYVASTDPVKYETSMLRDPDRLIVDISNAVLTKEFDDIPVRHEILQGIRIEQPAAKTVRVIMDLARVVGFDVRRDEVPSRLVVTLELPKGAGGLLSQKIVVIDPGHGGPSDTGARGRDGALEKHYNLALATRVQKLLAHAGVTALMTRTSDTTLGLADRANFAKRHSADLFVSIHHNASTPPRSGTETYYHGREMSGRALAHCVHSEVIKVVGLPDRSVKSDFVMYKTGFGVLRRAVEYGIPAILIEVGFINHPGDCARIKDPEFQQKVAEAIVRGLKSYIEGNPAPISRPEKVEPQPSQDSGEPDIKPEIEVKPSEEPSFAPQQADTPTAQPDKPTLTTGPRRPGEKSR